MTAGGNSTIEDYAGTTMGAILGERGGNAKPRQPKNRAHRAPEARSTISVQKSKAHYYKSVRLENDNHSVKQNEQPYYCPLLRWASEKDEPASAGIRSLEVYCVLLASAGSMLGQNPDSLGVAASHDRDRRLDLLFLIVNSNAMAPGIALDLRKTVIPDLRTMTSTAALVGQGRHPFFADGFFNVAGMW